MIRRPKTAKSNGAYVANRFFHSANIARLRVINPFPVKNIPLIFLLEIIAYGEGIVSMSVEKLIKKRRLFCVMARLAMKRVAALAMVSGAPRMEPLVSARIMRIAPHYKPPRRRAIKGKRDKT